MMERYVVLEKKVGETPLSCAEAWRATRQELAGVPLAYAGRLDPMASGKLLVLIGEECKNQTAYHGLEKAYDFSVLFGVESDTQDVLGRLKICELTPSVLSVAAKPSDVNTEVTRSTFETRPTGEVLSDAFQKQSSQLQPTDLAEELQKICNDLVGTIKLPYPTFSAKTVRGKPLHMWTLEGRLDEIEIPTKESEIYLLELIKIETLSREQVRDQARAKIDTIPEVTDPRKALGADFRRVDVRADWEHIKNDTSLPDTFTIAHFSCIASSGTYMRTLASVIAKQLGTCGLAWHIHRTHIGKYNKENKNWDLEY